jgi:hypothetical protein
MYLASPRLALTGALLLGLGTITAPAAAGTTAFQGDFHLDNDLAVFVFDLVAVADISASTSSHAAGGFAPVLTLFDAGGANIGGNIGSSNTCPGAGSFCWDASFTFPGALPGHYTLVLSQDDNLPNGLLGEGYSRDNEPYYTVPYKGQPADPDLQFVRIDGDVRTGHWALEITVPATVTQVPEPASALLMALGLAGFGLAHRRRQSV